MSRSLSRWSPAQGGDRRRDRRRAVPKWIVFIGLSLLLHVFTLAGLAPYWSTLTKAQDQGKPIPVTLVIAPPEQKPKEEEKPEVPKGQVVDVARPKVEKRPDQARFLAEHDQTVDKETRTDRFRINPKVLSDRYSKKDQLQFEDLLNLNIHEPSTGARIGNDRFEPDRDGSLAALPSPFTLTNRQGLQRPVPASTTAQDLSGAPNNDLIDAPKDDRLALNTKAWLGASYINRIKRLVNFYWSQNLDNLPPSVRLSRPSYTTGVYVVLDGDGALQEIEVTRKSGVGPLDNAVVEAFKIAGPFPNPPQQLIAKDGRVYLPDFNFTVEVGQARSRYSGVDPRQGVRFPGILKSPY